MEGRRRLPNFGCRGNFQIVFVGFSAISAVAENSEMAMDKVTDEELRAFRDQKIIKLRAHRRQFIQEKRQTVPCIRSLSSVSFTTLPENRASLLSAGLTCAGQRRSCAISSRNKFLRQHMRLRIKSQTVDDETGSDEWFVCDTGPGLHPLQIDFYRGEDEPRGAVGRQVRDRVALGWNTRLRSK